MMIPIEYLTDVNPAIQDTDEDEEAHEDVDDDYIWLDCWNQDDLKMMRMILMMRLEMTCVRGVIGLWGED